MRHKNIRLRDYDYGGAGAYFVTICTEARRCSLCRIDSGGVRLSEFGVIAGQAWQTVQDKRPYVQACEFVIMPNHVHMLFCIVRTEADMAARYSSPAHGRHRFQRPSPQSVATIVGGLKSAVTREVNRRRATPGTPFWQVGYYEHVIREASDFEAVSNYMLDNPARWMHDRENPDAEPDAREMDFWKDRLRLVSP